MPAAGATAMAIFLAHRPLRRRSGRRMLMAVALFGLATIVFGLSSSLPLSLAALFVLGASDMISVYVRQTLVQIETPDLMRGRVAAVNAVFVGASNELGEFESGVLAAFVGAVGAVVAGGIGTVLVAGLWARWFPALRDRDRLIAEAAARPRTCSRSGPSCGRPRICPCAWCSWHAPTRRRDPGPPSGPRRGARPWCGRPCRSAPGSGTRA